MCGGGVAAKCNTRFSSLILFAVQKGASSEKEKSLQIREVLKGDLGLGFFLFGLYLNIILMLTNGIQR